MKARLLFLLVLLTLGLGSKKALAVTNNWLGLSTSWNATTNWSQGHLPLSTEDVTIFLSSVTNGPTVNVAAVCQSLTITSVVPTTVTTITMSNTLTVGTSVTITTPTTITGASLLKSATLSISGVAFIVNAPFTTTGLATIGTGTTITSNAPGILNFQSAAVTASTFTLAGNLNITAGSGTPLSFTGINTFNTGAGIISVNSGGSVALNSGTLTLGSPLKVLGGAFSCATGAALVSNAAETISGAINITGNTTFSGASAISCNSLAVAGATLISSAPLTSSGTISMNASGNITTNAGGTISAGALSTGGSNTLSVGAAASVGAVTVNGTTTFSGASSLSGTTLALAASQSLTINCTTAFSGSATLNSSSTLTTTAALSASSMSLTGTTLALGSTLTLTGALTASSSSTITSTSGSTITAASLTFASGTYTFNGLLTISGGIAISSSAVTITTNASGNTFGTSMTVPQPDAFTWNGSGSSTLTGNPSFGFGSSFTNGTGNTLIFPANTNMSYSGTQRLFTNNGIIQFASGCTLATSNGSSGIVNTGTITAISSTIGISGGANTITNTGTITMTGGTITLGNTGDHLTNSGTGSTITLVNATLNMAGAGAYFSNASTFSATGCTFTFGNQNSITNTSTGTFTAQTGCSFTMTTSGPNIVTNNGNYTDKGSTYNVIAQTGNITNSGTGATMHFTGSTITYSTGTGQSFNNSATLTADGSTTINMNSQSSTIYNTTGGIFNAGVAQSPCIINIAGRTAGISNSATFNLGSTSIITNAGIVSAVTNTSPGVFTLLSDQYGSATLGETPVTGGNLYTGTFNVQRYLTGGNTNYRCYRLLSSPVNINASTLGVGNFSLSYLNTSASVVNANAVAGTTLNYGAFTAGSGAGFTAYNANPLIYLYIEALASSNASFISGKYSGVIAVTSTTIEVAANGSTFTPVNLPVGNGYLFYFIGNANNTNTAASRIPEATTITATGTINQNSANTYTAVKLWWNGSPSLSWISPTPATKGFNLMGNPYASTIDLQKVYSDNSNALGYTTFYELVDVNPGQPYVSYNANTGATSSSTYSSRYVASGQGFMVLTTAGSQTLTFKEDQKVYLPAILNSTSTPPILLGLKGSTISKTADSPKLKTEAIIPSAPLSGLHLRLMRDSTLFDECGIYFSNKWSDKFDNNDAYDIDGIASKVYMSSFTADGLRTGINSLGDYTKGKRVKLYVKAVTNGLYSLKMTDIANIDTAIFDVFLVDNFMKDSLNIGLYKTYKFNITNSDTTTYGSNRFVLSIERKPLPPYQLILFTAQKSTDGVLINWKAYNEGNFTGFAVQKQDASGQFSNLYNVQSSNATNYDYTDHNPVMGANVYRLLQNDINGKITYSNPVTVLYNPTTGGLSITNVFTVYPSPSKSLITVNVNSANSATPSYVSKIYNILGEVVAERSIHNNTWTEDVSSYKSGTYIIMLKDSQGNLIGKTKFEKTN